MHEDHGPVRYGPPAPDPGLPVLPELAAVLAAAADRTCPEPPGGGAPCARRPAPTGPGAGCTAGRRTSWPPPATSRSSSP
ncbi:protein of unknown function [Streptomyces sp. KY75]|nr:protein of unknown function [Streptomyces sp. KY75]